MFQRRAKLNNRKKQSGNSSPADQNRSNGVSSAGFLNKSFLLRFCLISTLILYPMASFFLDKDRKEANVAIVENAGIPPSPFKDRALLTTPMTTTNTNTNPTTAEVVIVATDDAKAKDTATGADLNSKQDKPQVISSSNLRGAIDTSSTTSSTFNVSHSITGSTPTHFERYDGVAIVTKVLFVQDIQNLKEWVCLINHSYNDRMKYDFVIFTTMPWNPEDVAKLQKVAYPAKLTVAVEAAPLEEQLAAMTKDEVEFLNDRCKVGNGTISWFHYCTEPGSRHVNNLGYSWQAEFRAYHIWTHPALKDYKYMIWIDADAGIGKEWDVDPMKAMVENDLTVLYAGFPYGKIRNSNAIKDKLIHSYGTSICNIGRTPDAAGVEHIYAKTCTDKPATIHQIAGNHHITNLDVFRKDVHQQFLKNFTGDHRFSRMADDQLAVTIVGLMEQYIVNNHTDVPKKFTVWHERSHGMTLKIAHHNMFDVVKSDRAPHRRKKLFNKIKGNWTGLEERCGAVFARKD
jgi:hypothetical protein